MTLRPLLTAVALLVTSVLPAEVKPFTFVHMSDVHIHGPENYVRAVQALRDVEEKFPETALIIVSGDLTEFGTADELTSYVKTMKSNTRIPVHSASGNHDSRWSDSGKENFRRIVGPSYKKVTHNGVHFILMDSSMLLEQYAHFEGQQLSQLEKDLKALPPGEPAILAMHHPPLSPAKFFDNEQRFAELIKKYNVPLVLTGHGHAFQKYSNNGTWYAMGGSTFGIHVDQSSYAAYKVTTSTMTRSLRRFVRGKSHEDITIPLQRDTASSLAIAEDGGSTEAASRKFVLSRTDGEKVDGPCEYSIDSLTTFAMVGDRIDIDAHALSPGIHQLVAKSTGSRGTTDSASIEFATERPEAEQPKITTWYNLKSGCQSHPTVDGDVLYVGANDHLLRAIDLATTPGKVLWEADLKSEVVSSPVVKDKVVVVGSMDSHVYCLDKATGKQLWKYKTGLAVFSTPLIVDDTVYVGSGDKKLYALNLKNGKKRWHFAAKAHIKMTPAHANGRLFFGAWDNTFYCVDAKSGKLIWDVPVSTDAMRFSAATCNPVVTDKGTIILCSHDYSVRCFDQKTGAQNWIYRPFRTAEATAKENELGPSYSRAVLLDGVAYFGSINGHLVGHNIETGAKVFDLELRPEKVDPVFDSLPLLVGNRIYVGSIGGNVYCVDVPAKKVAWSVALQPGAIFTGPAWWKGHLLVGSLADKVFQIKAE